MPTAPIAILPAASEASAPDDPVVILAEIGAGGAPTSPAVALGAAGGGSAPDDPLVILSEIGDGSPPSSPVVALSVSSGALSIVTLAGSLTDDGSPVVFPDLIYAGEIGANQYAWTSTGSWPRPTSGTYYEVIVLKNSEAATLRKYVDATIAAGWINTYIGPNRTDPDGVEFSPAVSGGNGAGGTATASLIPGISTPDQILPPATGGAAPDNPDTILASITGATAPTSPQPILGVPLHGVYDTDGVPLTDTDGAILTN